MLMYMNIEGKPDLFIKNIIRNLFIHSFSIYNKNLDMKIHENYLISVEK